MATNSNVVANVVDTLEALGFVREPALKAELSAKTLPQLMKDFILPRCLCLPRSGVRYPRIASEFMALMAKHGQDFLAADYELGSVLLECAMQRITRHPDLPAIDYKGNLPAPYKAYAASAINPDGMNGCPDEPGLWGTEAIDFLLSQLPACLALRDAKFSGHAWTILFQLVTMLGKGEFLWMNGCYCPYSEDSVLKSAVQMCAKCGFNQKMVDCCTSSGDWRSGLALFGSSWFSVEDELYLLSKIDLDRETYYKGFKRAMLKLFRKYDKLTKQKISEELCRLRRKRF